MGRNTWMMWCAGNEGFWDWLATDSLGFIDLLKLVDSRNRNDRFESGGLINEPGMGQSSEPVDHDFGLWLDTPLAILASGWRSDKYLARTFQAITAGEHKSQIGLKGQPILRRRSVRSPLYRAIPRRSRTRAMTIHTRT